MAKKKDKKPKKEIVEIERKGKCLKCGKPMVKNHQSCNLCNKKKRLMAKANHRGKNKYYYLR